MPPDHITDRRRSVAWADPAPLAAVRRGRSGFEFFGAIAAGALPQPPIYDLLGFRLTEVGRGAARFLGGTGEYLVNPMGTVHGGYTATLCDSACGIAVQSMLRTGLSTATIRLEVSFLRAIRPGSGEVATVSRLVHLAPRIGWSECDVLGAGGTVMARARGRFAVFPVETGPEGAIPETVYARRDYGWDDPARLVAAIAEFDGLGFIAAMADGTLPPPPIERTVGLSAVSVAHGRVVYRCTPEGCHYNPMGGVHGGLAAILIDTAGGAAIQTALPPGVASAAINLSVDYFRPISRETGPLAAEARLVRAGRRISLADAEVKDAAGRVYARGAVTYFSYPVSAGGRRERAGARAAGAA